MSIPDDREIKRLLTSGQKKDLDLGIKYARSRYYRYIRKTIRSQSNGRLSDPDIDELCNSVLIALWKNVSRGKYDSQGRLKAYLRRIASNLCYRFLRDQGRNPEFLPGEDWFFNDQTPASLLDPLELPPEKLRMMLNQRDLFLLRSCMEEILDERDYDIIWSFYFDDCSAQEIADRYGGTSNWVRQRLYVSRRKLRDCRDSKQKE